MTWDVTDTMVDKTRVLSMVVVATVVVVDLLMVMGILKVEVERKVEEVAAGMAMEVVDSGSNHYICSIHTFVSKVLGCRCTNRNIV